MLSGASYLSISARFFQNQPLLDKYVALYVTEMINAKEYLKAVESFCKYGTPANQQVHNLSGLRG